MTREQIADGLMLIVLLLANGAAEPPTGWAAHDWAYMKGIASAELLRQRDRLVPRETVSDRADESQT
jgi:hypothetical protein